MLMNLLTIIVFLLMFMVLVSVHEWGHYLLARYYKMGVSEFSVGIGPVVKTWKKKKYIGADGEEQETKFRFRAIPLGGFVKIVGMEPKDDGSEVHEPGGFYSKPAIQRIVVLFAGPVFSLVFGLMVLTATFTAFGTYEPNNVVSEPMPGQPAVLAGIKTGDRILSIDGTPVKRAQEATKIIRASSGEPITFKIERGAKTFDLSVKPTLSEDERAVLDNDGVPTGEYKKIPQVGIAFGVDHIYPGLGKSVAMAAEFPVEQVRMMILKITTPRVLIENSTGVVGMVVITKSAVENGFSQVFLITGLISISLGIFNLLPLGFLDGGQIFLSLIEIARRGRRVSNQTQAGFFIAGMALIGCLVVFRIYKDMYQYVLPGKENVMTGIPRKTPSPAKTPAESNNAPSSTNSNAPEAPVK